MRGATGSDFLMRSVREVVVIVKPADVKFGRLTKSVVAA